MKSHMWVEAEPNLTSSSQSLRGRNYAKPEDFKFQPRQEEWLMLHIAPYLVFNTPKLKGPIDWQLVSEKFGETFGIYPTPSFLHESSCDYFEK
jgi:hypothetical protein